VKDEWVPVGSGDGGCLQAEPDGELYAYERRLVNEARPFWRFDRLGTDPELARIAFTTLPVAH
jgi:hypothetical protein